MLIESPLSHGDTMPCCFTNGGCDKEGHTHHEVNICKLEIAVKFFFSCCYANYYQEV